MLISDSAADKKSGTNGDLRLGFRFFMHQVLQQGKRLKAVIIQT